MRRTADVSLEAADKVRFADAAHPGKVVQRNIIGKMTVNVRQCRCKQLTGDGGSHGLRRQTTQNAVYRNGNLVLVHGGKLRAHAVLRRVHDRAELILERQHRLLFVHKAESLGQIFGVLLAARTVEVKPVEVNLVRTPVAVRLAAVEQRYFALMRLGGHTVCADAERTTVDVDQQVLVNAVSFDPVIAVADELTELRAVIQRAFRKFGRQ